MSKAKGTPMGRPRALTPAQAREVRVWWKLKQSAQEMARLGKGIPTIRAMARLYGVSQATVINYANSNHKRRQSDPSGPSVPSFELTPPSNGAT
jgi:DNA invertase Pin-like site-specific DNA recombinase